MIKLVAWETSVWQDMVLPGVFPGFVSIVKKLDLLVSIRLGLHIQQIILQLEWTQMSTTERFE